MSTSRFCNQCGRSDGRSDAKFCSECGSPFDSKNLRTPEFHSGSSATSMQAAFRSDSQTVIVSTEKEILKQPSAVTSQRFKGSDSWHDGLFFKNITYKTLKGSEGITSLELIRSGDRTAFSSDSIVYNAVNVGDLFRLTRKTDNVTVRIVEVPYPTESISAKKWSELEGLDPSLYGALFSQNGYFQFRFELVNPDPIDVNWNPINPSKSKGQKNNTPLTTKIGGSQPRRFRLPDKTTMEQDFALELPETDFYLLLGGPGTGNTSSTLPARKWLISLETDIKPQTTKRAGRGLMGSVVSNPGPQKVTSVRA